MVPGPAPKEISEPFPISCVSGRYLLFDADVVAHCRRSHNICGVLVGTIPNLSQQNVFLGLPLELMPEEARVLVEKGHAYIVDDAETHRQGFGEMSREDRLRYLQEMDRQGLAAGQETLNKQEKRKDKALKKKGLRKDASTQPTSVDATAQLVAPVASDIGLIMKGSAFSSTPIAQKSVPSAPTQGSILVEESAPAEEPTHVADEPTPVAAAVEAPATISPVTQPTGSGLAFIMKGSSFTEDGSSVVASAPTPAEKKSAIPAAASQSTTGSGLGFLMKGSPFAESTSAVKVEAAPAVEVTSEVADPTEDAPSEPAAEEELTAPIEASFVEAAPVKDAPIEAPSAEAPAPTPVVDDVLATLEAAIASVEAASVPEDADPPVEDISLTDPPEEDISLFGAASTPVASKSNPNAPRQYITPTTSHPPLPVPAASSAPLPPVPRSYPLFRYLHSRGFFHMPGLRFGCNYSVYPGDPLRYHSHFLATGLGWDDKFALQDVVGGGRLGTGTKKAYMIGGEDPTAQEKEPVRAFSVEWASM